MLRGRERKDDAAWQEERQGREGQSAWITWLDSRDHRAHGKPHPTATAQRLKGASHPIQKAWRKTKIQNRKHGFC